MSALWESKSFRRVAGHAWRPGGLDLTARGLVLCQKLCGLAPGHLVVDLGCGPGGTVRLLQQAGYGVLGLDRQVSSAVAGGRGLAQKPESSDHGWRFVQADIARLPLANACVQGLVCECVLSLLPDPVQALRGCLRVLRPGGVLLFSDLTRRDGGGSAAFTPAVASASSASSASSGAPGAPGPGAADTEGSPQGVFLPGPDGSGKVPVTPGAPVVPVAPVASVAPGAPVASVAPALSVTPGAYDTYDTDGKSCMDGACSAFLWDAYLRKAGFRVVHYEDHSRTLVELAARMLWYSEDEPVGMPGVATVAGDAGERSLASASLAQNPGASASAAWSVAAAPGAPGTPGASSGGCTCSLSGNGRKFGYGLWIAQKEHA